MFTSLLGFGLPVSGAWATPDMIDASRAAPRSSGTRRCGPSSVSSPPSAPSSARRTTRCWTRSSRSPTSRGTPSGSVSGRRPCARRHRSRPAREGDDNTGRAVRRPADGGARMGWLPEEYAAAGVPFERRGARMDEYLRCLEALWTQDPVEFAGEFYTVPRSHTGPRPVQRPHPPVLLGGAAAPALRRAGRLAQGWIASSKHDVRDLRASIETVREGAREAGRDPDALRIVVRRHAGERAGSRGAARAGRHGGPAGSQLHTPDRCRVRGARARRIRARERIDVARPPSSAGIAVMIGNGRSRRSSRPRCGQSAACRGTGRGSSRGRWARGQ